MLEEEVEGQTPPVWQRLLNRGDRARPFGGPRTQPCAETASPLRLQMNTIRVIKNILKDGWLPRAAESVFNKFTGKFCLTGSRGDEAREQLLRVRAGQF